ncbi:MAG: hypothetical protein U0Q18_05100 [Bryobacteraceae bacterium]
MRRAPAIALWVIAVSATQAADLRPETVQAFDRYVRETESHLDERLRPGARFLWSDDQTKRLSQVRSGQVVVELAGARDTIPVPGGLIHDWIGAVFVPGATLKNAIDLAQNYNHHKDFYKPEVMDSRLLSRNGNDFKIYLRLLKKKVITVVLDTDHEVHYFPLDSTREHSRSYATRIAEVQDPGKSDERVLQPGEGHGFLWRLNSYWRFQERDGGVYIECQAVSLSRGIPAGLGWMIEPIIKSLPRESLTSTLVQTRQALTKH